MTASVTYGRALRYAKGSARGLLHHHMGHSLVLGERREPSVEELTGVKLGHTEPNRKIMLLLSELAMGHLSIAMMTARTSPNP